MASIFSIFKRGLEKSATKLSRVFTSVFTGIKAHSAESFDDLEALLISSDFGVTASVEIVAELKDLYDRGVIATDADLVADLRKQVTSLLHRHERSINYAEQGVPTVILMVGVNGSGKTTTIGKLAHNLISDGKSVVLGACDTFRAAAVEQLQLWGNRTGAHVVSSKHGADPASVAYDAMQSAISRKADFLLLDTAGRQQNQRDLMAELAKIKRSIQKVCPTAPNEVWLTVDASLGANVISQAKEFSKCVDVTGLVLTKLDGTGRGGMAVALHREFELPTFYVGLGEQPEDLQEFSPEFYADALFGKQEGNA